MNVIRRLRLQFIAVFMGLMLAFSVAIGAFVYVERKSELEYQCMVYLLDIHNYGNKENASVEPLTAYPPFFVIEIDNLTNTAQVVEGRFFLGDNGTTMDELIGHLIGRMDESGVLQEYGVRYFNGVREERSHRVSFIDVTYIADELHALLGRIVLIEVPILLILLIVSLFLARWFSKPAKQAMDEQTRFIAKVSHELKTPVSIIRANIDLIDGEKGADEANFVFGCENIRHECDRMTGLVEAMLMTGLTVGSGEQSQEKVDFTTLLEREMLRFEVVAFDHGLALTHDAEPDLTVRGDAIQLTRLVDIVVENAVKYCSPGGEIRVTAEQRSGLVRRVRLTCANDGEELTKEQKENIFKPFYQVDGTKKGAGLGLSIANEIVTSMRGTIQYEYANGKNSFIIEL